jgi:hypothetical protein
MTGRHPALAGSSQQEVACLEFRLSSCGRVDGSLLIDPSLLESRANDSFRVKEESTGNMGSPNGVSRRVLFCAPIRMLECKPAARSDQLEKPETRFGGGGREFRTTGTTDFGVCRRMHEGNCRRCCRPTQVPALAGLAREPSWSAIIGTTPAAIVAGALRRRSISPTQVRSLAL